MTDLTNVSRQAKIPTYELRNSKKAAHVMNAGTIEEKQASPERGALFVLLSLLVLGVFVAGTAVSTESLVRSSLVAIALFALFYKMAAKFPVTHKIPGPKTVVDHVLFWPVFAFYLYPAQSYSWTYVGLAIALVGFSVYGMIRQFIESRSN